MYREGTLCMLSYDDFQALTQVTDTTWGKASTDAAPTMSVKMTFTTDHTAIVKYLTVITYQGQLTVADEQKEYAIAEQVIKTYLKDVKKAFKELTGRAVKLKVVNIESIVEMIDLNTFSPLATVRTAYYRCLGEVEAG